MKAPSRHLSGVVAAGAVALAVVSGTAGAALVLPTPAFAATTSASELVVDDNYPSLYGWIHEGARTAKERAQLPLPLRLDQQQAQRRNEHQDLDERLRRLGQWQRHDRHPNPG